jgi:transposase-like protein
VARDRDRVVPADDGAQTATPLGWCGCDGDLVVCQGLDDGEISAHLAEVYDVAVSRETISKITDAIVGEMNEWFVRPLDRVYPVIFIEAIHVKVRDGQVANRAFYCAIGVTVDGQRDILGIWASNGSEGAKFWLGVLTELRNRGVLDVCIVVCDGLKGLPDAINTIWPRAIVQTCVLHPIRNTFRLASRQHWERMARDLRPVYTAPNEPAAKERFNEFAQTWCEKFPAIRSLWDNAWTEFVPFLDFSPEIRRVIYSTNAIESLHARFRRSTRARGHFPNEQAALKCLVPRRANPRPDRSWQRTMDEPMEAGTQRVRRNDRRPPLPWRSMTYRQLTGVCNRGARRRRARLVGAHGHGMSTTHGRDAYRNVRYGGTSL